MGLSLADQSCSAVLHNSVLQQATSDSQVQLTNLHNKIDTFHSSLLNDSNQKQDGFIRAMKEQAEKNQTEIVFLRDLMLKFMTEETASTTGVTPKSAQLGSQVDVNLESQLGRQLAITPSSLKDTCENLSTALTPASSHSFPLRKSKTVACNHKCKQQTLGTKHYGPFSFAYNRRSSHSPDCPYHRFHASSWSCSLFIQLLPLISKTVELTFLAKFGAGGNSIGPLIKFFGTVERKSCTAFQLLDSFPQRCASSARGQRNATNYDFVYPFHYDKKLLEIEMPKLCSDLYLFFFEHHNDACFCDERGNTLLHVRDTILPRISKSNSFHEGHIAINWKSRSRVLPIFRSATEFS